MPVWAGERPDEPFDVKAFLTSRSPPTDNAAPLYLAALAPLDRALGGEPSAALEKQITELANFDKLAAGTVPASQIEQALAQAVPALSQVDAAQAKPNCVFVTGLSVDALLPHAQAARTVSELTVLEIARARTTGDYAAAERAMERSLRLSRDLQPRGFHVCELVAHNMDGMILTAIERLTLADPRLTADQCNRIIRILDEHQKQRLNGGEEWLKMDYIMSRNAIHDLQTQRLTLDQIYDFLLMDHESDPILKQPSHFHWEAEIEACNHLFKLAFAAARKPSYDESRWNELNEELARRKGEAKAFQRLAAETPRAQTAQLRERAPSFLFVTWAAPIEVIFEMDRRIMAQRAGTQMLLALRRYEIAHGSLPADLQMAVAESPLKSVPTDPYDGAPLRFAVVEGKPIVYSIAADLKDDGGKVEWKYGKQPGDYLFVLPPRAR